MTQLRPLGRRPASIRAAVARSRETRLRAVERRLLAQLAFLRRRGPDEYDALVGLLRRVLARQSRRSR